MINTLIIHNNIHNISIHNKYKDITWHLAAAVMLILCDIDLIYQGVGERPQPQKRSFLLLPSARGSTPISKGHGC